ncbi:MAG: DUF1700 domain-containing protein [Actinomycetota bacterium]|nr:DUF1700 domain-containing protein [Actinomycetota bacterium]
MTGTEIAAADAGRRRLDDLLGTIGGVLLPLGLALVALGWYGAAHTPYLFEQVPYLISGGVFGLGLVIVAGLLYVGSWVSRTAADQQAASAQLLAVLQDIRDELEVSRVPPARRTTGGNGSLVATRSGSMIHRPDCSVVAGRPDVRAVSAGTSGLQPCQLCDPLSTGDRVSRR